MRTLQATCLKCAITRVTQFGLVLVLHLTGCGSGVFFSGPIAERSKAKPKAALRSQLRGLLILGDMRKQSLGNTFLLRIQEFCKLAVQPNSCGFGNHPIVLCYQLPFPFLSFHFAATVVVLAKRLCLTIKRFVIS